MISLMLQNLGRKGNVSDLLEIEVSKKAKATKGELGGPIVSKSDGKLLSYYIDRNDTIDNGDKYGPIISEI